MEQQWGKLEMFLAEVQKTGTSESSGSVHSVTVRIPTIEFATVEALVRSTGMTRNKIIVNLVQIGLEKMWLGLSKESHDSISAIEAAVLRDLVQDNQGNIKTLDQGEKGDI